MKQKLKFKYININESLNLEIETSVKWNGSSNIEMEIKC